GRRGDGQRRGPARQAGAGEQLPAAAVARVEPDRAPQRARGDHAAARLQVQRAVALPVAGAAPAKGLRVGCAAIGSAQAPARDRPLQDDLRPVLDARLARALGQVLAVGDQGRGQVGERRQARGAQPPVPVLAIGQC
ncbi:MAG: hypothetical protein ACK56I_31805, partial [bacterium]